MDKELKEKGVLKKIDKQPRKVESQASSNPFQKYGVNIFENMNTLVGFGPTSHEEWSQYVPHEVLSNYNERKNKTNIPRQYLNRDSNFFNQRAAIIYECKDDCRTIIDVAHIKEMMRYISHAVDDPLWPKICMRRHGLGDGANCGLDAYNNMTYMVEPMIDHVTDLFIQTFVGSFIQDTDKYNEMKKALDRNFKPNNPYSKFMLSSLEFGSPVFESKWQLHNETGMPLLEEMEVEHLNKKQWRDAYNQFYWNLYNKAMDF